MAISHGERSLHACGRELAASCPWQVSLCVSRHSLVNVRLVGWCGHSPCIVRLIYRLCVCVSVCVC